MGDDLWYPTMRSPPLPLLRAHPAATANLSARSLEGFVRDHQIPDSLKTCKQPGAVSQWPDQQPSPSVITPIIEIGA